MSEITIWILNASNGMPLAVLDQFDVLEYVKVTNNVGAFSVQVPSSFDFSLLREDTRVCIYRKPTSGAKILDFVGLIRYVERRVSAGQMYRTVAGPCINDLLNTRIVAYAAGSAEASKTDNADNMLKAIVRENLGSSAIAARDLSSYGLTVEADMSLGTSLSKGMSWRKVLDVLREISDSSHSTETTCVYFGLVPLNVGWECEFRTRIGQWGDDRRFGSGTSPIIFSLDFGNVSDVTRSTDWRDEATHVYAGGQGEGAERVIQEASDAERASVSPFNRREDFEDARNETVAGNVLAVAQSALRAKRPKNIFDSKLVDTRNYIYGRDYALGDYITAVFKGETIDARIESVSVRVANGAESVQVVLKSEI